MLFLLILAGRDSPIPASFFTVRRNPDIFRWGFDLRLLRAANIGGKDGSGIFNPRKTLTTLSSVSDVAKKGGQKPLTTPSLA